MVGTSVVCLGPSKGVRRKAGGWLGPNAGIAVSPGRGHQEEQGAWRGQVSFH